MVDRIRNLLARFPEDERAVREMIRNHPDFDALCEEYAEIDKELKRLVQLKDAAAAAQSDSLQKRRMAIEEELLTLMEGHQPV